MDFLQFPYIIVHRTKTSLNWSALSVSVNSGRLGGFVLVNIYPDMKSSYLYKWMILIYIYGFSIYQDLLHLLLLFGFYKKQQKFIFFGTSFCLLVNSCFPFLCFLLWKTRWWWWSFFFFFFHSSSFGIIMQVWWTACFLYMVCIRIYDLCMIELILFKEK